MNLLWDSQSRGTAKRGAKGYVPFRPEKKYTKKLTEAEDNARARAQRRRTNRALRGWLPYAQR